ncbi:MAG TPA: F0F1 ATP synthase subunit B [Acidimicrobiales bacterium]|nr:F0F1 ATP synthase subunit B [Acidimicrobiales bacterium]
MIARITADGQIHLRVEDTESEDGVSTEPGEAVEEHAGEDESHNPILPETSELVYAVIAFLVLLALMWKFAFPAVQKAMDGRTQRIRDNLDEAERTKAEAQRILEEYQRQLADAKNESARIIDEARQTAEQMRRDLMVRAEAEVNELRDRSRQEIEAAQVRAVADLRTQVSELAIGAAEVVVQKNLDRDTNRALVERYIEQVGSNA